MVQIGVTDAKKPADEGHGTIYWAEPLLFPGGDHFGDPANARVACVQVALLVPGQVVGFDELALAGARSVAHGSEDVAILINLQELAILTARHPEIALRVEIDGARQVSHLNRPDEFAVCRIDDEAIFLPVTYPHIAILGIHGDAMGHAEFSLSDAVAVPLLDEPAALIEVDDTRGT